MSQILTDPKSQWHTKLSIDFSLTHLYAVWSVADVGWPQLGLGLSFRLGPGCSRSISSFQNSYSKHILLPMKGQSTSMQAQFGKCSSALIISDSVYLTK